MGVNMPS